MPNAASVAQEGQMAFKIDLGEKFGCIALVNVWREKSLTEPVDLGGDLWAVFEPPLQLADYWEKWIGSISVDHLKRANLFLFAKAASKAPAILDEENEALVKKVSYFFYGLLLFGIPQYERGFHFNGANESGKPEVRQFGELDEYRQTVGNERLSEVGLDTLKSAAASAQTIRKIADREMSERLNRGFASLLRAVQELEGGERLHQYVRALEAVVHPGIAKSTKQFVHRCLTFVGVDGSRMEKAREALKDAYEIRSQVEHQNGWEAALDGYPAGDREHVAKLRLRQAEGLALSVYRKITISSGLSAHFQSDSSLDGFWQFDDGHRRSQWSDPFDICSVV